MDSTTRKIPTTKAVRRKTKREYDEGHPISMRITRILHIHGISYRGYGAGQFCEADLWVTLSRNQRDQLVNLLSVLVANAHDTNTGPVEISIKTTIRD